MNDYQNEIDNAIDALCDELGIDMDSVPTRKMEALARYLEVMCNRIHEEGYQAGQESAIQSWQDSDDARALYGLKNEANELVEYLELRERPCVDCELSWGMHAPWCLVKTVQVTIAGTR